MILSNFMFDISTKIMLARDSRRCTVVTGPDLNQYVLEHQQDITNEVFDHILSYMHSYIMALCTRFYFSGQQQVDMYQVCLIELFHSIQTYKGGTGHKSFANWAYYNIKCKVLSGVTHYRLAEIAPEKQVPLDVCGDYFLISDKFMEDIYCRDELPIMLRRIKKRLTPVEFLVFNLHMLQGVRYKEIIRRTGLRHKTIDNAVARIKDKYKLFKNK